MPEGAAQSGLDEPFSIGGYLKAQRKIRGVGLEELSVRTRIPLRSLDRLEAGAFDGHPDGFVRGFVRTVSEGLGLDPDDTLMRMLSEPPFPTVRRPSHSTSTTHPKPPARPLPGWWKQGHFPSSCLATSPWPMWGCIQAWTLRALPTAPWPVPKQGGSEPRLPCRQEFG